LVDMAYKIRSAYEFDWEKLLEEDLEEADDDDDDDEAEFFTAASSSGRKRVIRIEKPSIHLHRYNHERPIIGPGVLLNA